MAKAKFKWYFFAESWPKLLQKLSLDDGMKCFLEWKDQYEDWCSHYGINIQGVGQFIGLEALYHAFYLLDHQLLDVLMDRMEEENFQGMDHETFVQELLDIFEEESQDDEDLDEEFDEEEEDDVALEDLDEEKQDEIALDDLNIISAGRTGTEKLADPLAEKLPEPPDSSMPDPMAEELAQTLFPGSRMPDSPMPD